MSRLILLCLCLASVAFADDAVFDALTTRFVSGYQELKIPELQLSYVENFKGIHALEDLHKQKYFIESFDRKLDDVDRDDLSPDKRYDYDTLRYFLTLERERIRLETLFKEVPAQEISTAGIYQIPNGKPWYRYYLKKWSSKPLSPAEVLHLGYEEIARVRREISKIQSELGYAGKDAEFYEHLNAASFFITSEKSLQSDLEAFQKKILVGLPTAFEKTDIPLVGIQSSPKPDKDSPPGYYEDGVFYFNFFGGKFNRRSLPWLFLHEAIPGHHYQHSVAAPSALGKVAWYPGFTEGWGAYAETLGREIGAYATPYDSLGKWEWDLVRSTRVVLDIGINYLGWSKQKAMEFWKQNIPNQDAIAEREIDRMIRWPGQVLAYKVGEREFRTLRDQVRDPKLFHSLVLKRGSIPLSVLESVVGDALEGMK